LKYVGSNFTGGELPENERCVRGFDNGAFIMGTSSSLFNQFALQINNTDVPELLKSALRSLLDSVGESNNDIADWSPNPFFGWNNQSNPGAQSKRLTLVDGGEDLQNIPLNPLIQPFRDVDVIFAVDSSADTSEPGANWPNGTALVATYGRSLNETMENGTLFPAIPDQNTFVNLGLNTRPTFFGCNASNFTGSPPPLLVYIPNHPYVYNSNVSTFDPSYNNTERNAIIENGYMVATMGNSTLDQQWPTCVGCAVMSRSWTKTNGNVPEVCNHCFQRFCWNGTRDSTPPAAFNPGSVFAQLSVSGAERLITPGILSVAAAIGTAAVLGA
jgi:lysophospholipase